MAVLVGAIGFIHTFNLPIVLALLVAIYGLRRYHRRARLDRHWLVSTGVFAVGLTAVTLLLYLPFYATYNTPTSDIQVTNGPDTRPFHLFLQWGLFLLLVTAGAVYTISRHAKGWRFTPGQMALAVAPAVGVVVLWAVLRPALAFGPELTAGASGWLSLVWLGATLTLLLLAIIRNVPASGEGTVGDPVTSYALTLAALAVLVLLVSELFFIDDVFDSRLNTVFKNWYVAWLLLGLAAVLSGYTLLRDWRPRLVLGRALYGVTAAAVGLLLVAGLIYPCDGHHEPHQRVRQSD